MRAEVSNRLCDSIALAKRCGASELLARRCGASGLLARRCGVSGFASVLTLVAVLAVRLGVSFVGRGASTPGERA